MQKLYDDRTCSLHENYMSEAIKTVYVLFLRNKSSATLRLTNSSAPESYVISAPTLPLFFSYSLSLPSIYGPTDGKWCYNELSHCPPYLPIPPHNTQRHSHTPTLCPIPVWWTFLLHDT